MKKTRILLLAMLLTFTLSGSASPTAEIVDYISDDFSYALDESGNAEITAYRGDDRDLRIPSEVDGHPVTSIGQVVFYYCRKLASMTLPDSLISMNGNPFMGLSDLSMIHVSPNHPVFAVIDGVLFNKEDKILVAYPATAKPGAYQVPSGTKIIGDSAFWCCTSLTSADLPEGLESIGDGAFTGCSGLESIVLPEGLKSIGEGAFWQCFELASVTLPDSLISMGANPFVDFHDLSIIHVSPNHPVFAVTEGVLFNIKDGILVAYPISAKPGVYQVPSGTRAIGANAFWSCTNLTSVVLPEGLESIGEFAFSYCSELESIELPKSLETIGYGVFEQCLNLVMTVPQDSYAQQYAQDNGIPYEVISK